MHQRFVAVVFTLFAVAPGALSAQRSGADSARFSALRWRSIGPARGGRVTAVAGVPSQPYTFYMGGTGGGVWKSTDAGTTWANVTDGQIAVGSIGAIRVADSDPNVVWVGTGSEAIRSNVSIGRGVWRSADAGRTWSFAGLRDVGQIGAIAVHPSNPDIAWVAALGNPFAPTPDRGVYRTRDGGKSWQKVLFVSDSTGAVKVLLDPSDPNVLYAAMWRAQRKPWTIISGAREGGIYKSSDGGDHWTKLGGGLPTGLVGKSDIAISASNPRRIYVLIEAAPGGGLYRSDDAGATFALVNTQASLLYRPFYYTYVDADPKNADIVYVNDESLWKSADAGKTFHRMNAPHGDMHDMWINPGDPNIILQSNDGGANVTLNGGLTWSTQYNQPTAELYQVATDGQYPYRVYGAQQDNTTVIVSSLPPTTATPDEPVQLWRQGPGCETGPILPHPTNPDTVYGGCKGQFSRLDLRTGQEKNYWVGAQFIYGHDPKDLKYRFQRVSPLAISPFDPKTIYFGSQFVHRTRDEGVTWERISPDLTANDPTKQGISGQPITRDITGEEFYSTLYAIRESPAERGVIWAGANDGPIHVTRDGGKTWTSVTPKDLPPGGRVQSIEPSAHARGTAYVAIYRYLLGDFQPYIYRTRDYGKRWTRLTDGRNGIAADEPTRVVREDPDRPGLLFAGTEFGIHVSFDDGAHWEPLQQNLPATPVTDIAIARKDLVISTQGRSFWILDDITPLEQLGDSALGPSAHLFVPRDAIRYRYQPYPPAPGVPDFPPPGATIDVWLSSPLDSSSKLEVLDAQGKVVRDLTSDLAERRDSALGTRRCQASATNECRVPSPAVGLRRITWDLAYPGPWDADSTKAGRDGPMVQPGRYQVRLVANGKTQVQPLVVKADPRVLADGVTVADLARQVQHNLRVRDAISAAKQLVARIDSVSKTDSTQRFASIRAQLVTVTGRYQQPMLIDQLQYLYGMTTSADQRIGADAVERLAELRSQLDDLLRRGPK